MPCMLLVETEKGLPNFFTCVKVPRSKINPVIIHIVLPFPTKYYYMTVWIMIRFDAQIHLVEFHPDHLQWMLAMWSFLEKEPPKERTDETADETEANNQPTGGDVASVKDDYQVDLHYSFPDHWDQGVRQLNLQFPRRVMEGLRKRAFNTDRVRYFDLLPPPSKNVNQQITNMILYPSEMK